MIFLLGENRLLANNFNCIFRNHLRENDNKNLQQIFHAFDLVDIFLISFE